MYVKIIASCKGGTFLETQCSYALLRRRIAPSSVVCPSVFLSLCQCVTLVSPEKTAETIKLPFAFRTRVGPTNHVLHEVQIPTWEGAILRGGNRQTIVNNSDTPRSSVQRRLNRSRCRLGCGFAWVECITCYMGGPDPPWEGAILVDRGAHCKV